MSSLSTLLINNNNFHGSLYKAFNTSKENTVLNYIDGKFYL